VGERGVIPDIVGALITGAHLPGVDLDDVHAKKGSTKTRRGDHAARAML
jgi:hypothetical protein